MTALNKQALREAAEKALNARVRLELIESIFDDDGDITTEAQEDIKICTAFNDLTNPDTVLALLDELEAAEKRNAELEARTVMLPDRKSELFWPGDGFEFDNLGYVIAVENAIRAAGIGVKGE
ncbi:ead/Ea22-like family protein [Citrobacter portucalensis]|uniref:ead/Ea22-like family protein n=1 Tax=Citrobacter portucalensis TaxID=1639133 RepID=UPI00388FC9BB